MRKFRLQKFSNSLYFFFLVSPVYYIKSLLQGYKLQRKIFAQVFKLISFTYTINYMSQNLQSHNLTCCKIA